MGRRSRAFAGTSEAAVTTRRSFLGGRDDEGTAGLEFFERDRSVGSADRASARGEKGPGRWTGQSCAAPRAGRSAARAFFRTGEGWGRRKGGSARDGKPQSPRRERLFARKRGSGLRTRTDSQRSGTNGAAARRVIAARWGRGSRGRSMLTGTRSARRPSQRLFFATKRSRRGARRYLKDRRGLRTTGLRPILWEKLSASPTTSLTRPWKARTARGDCCPARQPADLNFLGQCSAREAKLDLVKCICYTQR